MEGLIPAVRDFALSSSSFRHGFFHFPRGFVGKGPPPQYAAQAGLA